MSVDMTQFYSVLFEECLECLNSMETELNSIDLNAFDAEKMNTIYRGAHTIKGGCAMLEFHAVADYAKAMESLLGDMRDQRKPTTTENIAVMLESVAFVRAMITTLQNNEAVDEVSAQAHCAKMQQAIS